jgi:hypothetical protein
MVMLIIKGYYRFKVDTCTPYIARLPLDPCTAKQNLCTSGTTLGTFRKQSERLSYIITLSNDFSQG